MELKKRSNKRGTSSKTIRRIYDALVELDGKIISRKDLGLMTNTQYYSLQTTLELFDHMGLVEIIGDKVKYIRIRK